MRFESFSKQHSVNHTCNKPTHWACIRRGWSHNSCCDTSEPFWEGLQSVRLARSILSYQWHQVRWMHHGLPRRIRCLRRHWQRTAVTRRIGGTRSPALREVKLRFDLLIEDVRRIKLVKRLAPITGPPQKRCIHFHYLMLHNSYRFMQKLHYNKIYRWMLCNYCSIELWLPAKLHSMQRFHCKTTNKNPFLKSIGNPSIYAWMTSGFKQ